MTAPPSPLRRPVRGRRPVSQPPRSPDSLPAAMRAAAASSPNKPLKALSESSDYGKASSSRRSKPRPKTSDSPRSDEGAFSTSSSRIRAKSSDPSLAMNDPSSSRRRPSTADAMVGSAGKSSATYISSSTPRSSLNAPSASCDTSAEGQMTTTFAIVTSADVEHAQRMQQQAEEERRRLRAPRELSQRRSTTVRRVGVRSGKAAASPKVFAQRLPGASTSTSAAGLSKRRNSRAAGPVVPEHYDASESSCNELAAPQRPKQPDLVVISEPTVAAPAPPPLRAPVSKRFRSNRSSIATNIMTKATTAFYVSSPAYRPPKRPGGDPTSRRTVAQYDPAVQPEDNSWFAHLGLSFDLKAVPAQRMNVPQAGKNGKWKSGTRLDPAATPKRKDSAKLLRLDRTDSVVTVTGQALAARRRSRASSIATRQGSVDMGECRTPCGTGAAK